MAELFFDIQNEGRKRDKEFAEVEKFNPYHDSKGRFTTGSGASSFTYKPGASKAHDAAISREKGKSEWKHGGSGKPVKTIGGEKPSEMLGGGSKGGKDDYKTAMKKPSDSALESSIRQNQERARKGKKNQPEGDRAISNRKGGEIMDDIGTNKVSTSLTISALKQAGFKRKDIKQIQRQYDLTDAQAKEISSNWNKYR